MESRILKEKIKISSFYRLPKQQKTTFEFQAILGVKITFHMYSSTTLFVTFFISWQT
jgi:hypothetical protein